MPDSAIQDKIPPLQEWQALLWEVLMVFKTAWIPVPSFDGRDPRTAE